MVWNGCIPIRNIKFIGKCNCQMSIFGLFIVNLLYHIRYMYASKMELYHDKTLVKFYRNNKCYVTVSCVNKLKKIFSLIEQFENDNQYEKLWINSPKIIINTIGYAQKCVDDVCTEYNVVTDLFKNSVKYDTDIKVSDLVGNKITDDSDVLVVDYCDNLCEKKKELLYNNVKDDLLRHFYLRLI